MRVDYMIYGFWHSNAVAESNDFQFISTKGSFENG